MGQVTTQLEDRDLAKIQRKPDLEAGANKQGKSKAFDQLMDPLVDPLDSGDGSPNPLTPDALEAQQGATETPDLQSPLLQDTESETQGEDEEEQGDQPELQGQEKQTENQEDDGGDTPDEPENAEEQDEDAPEDGPENQKPETGGDKGDPSPKETPTQDKPGSKDNVPPGSDTSDDSSTSSDTGDSGTGTGTGSDGRLLDFAELSQGELNEYINEKAWHDYWVHRSDTGMATSDKASLVGRALGAGALEGLVNGVSAGLIQGVMAGALKKMRFAGGVFTAVEIFKMGPEAWFKQSGAKFDSAKAKWNTGDTIDKVEAVLDWLDGANTIIGQISGVCLLIAGLGSALALASVFFPLLLPLVGIIAPIIPLAANAGMLLGKINAIVGAALTFMRLVPIGLRAGQIMLSDADPALQAARAEKLSKQVSSFTEDASSRVVKTGTEKATQKGTEKLSGMFGNKTIAAPTGDASNKGPKTDEKHSKLKELFKIAFDTDHLTAKGNKKDFRDIGKEMRANRSGMNQIHEQNVSLRDKNKVAGGSESKANGLENLHGTLTDRMMSNKVSKKEAKLWQQVGSDATSARKQASVDRGRYDRGNQKYKSAILDKMMFREHHASEDFTGDQAKAWRDRMFGSMTRSGLDEPLEALKGLPDDGSVGSSDIPDSALEKSDPALYKIKKQRADDAQRNRASYVEGERHEVRRDNAIALSERRQEFQPGRDEFTEGQSEYSDRLLNLGQATSQATVDASMTPDQRMGMSEDQKSARDALRPQVQALMDRVDLARTDLQLLPPPPTEQESILTNAADNWAKIDAEVQDLNQAKAQLEVQKKAAAAQAQVADRAVQVGKQNLDSANKEKQTLEEKEKKREKAREDLEQKKEQAGGIISPISGFMSGVTDMVGWLMRIAGILPDDFGGDQVRAADPKGLETGLQKTQGAGTDTQKQLLVGIGVVADQQRLDVAADNWMNTGYTGLLTISARLAKDKAESQAANQQFQGAEGTLLDRLQKLEAGREAQRQRHAAAMATINTWTQAHRNERLKKQGQLDQDMNAVDALLQQAKQPTSAQVG